MNRIGSITLAKENNKLEYPKKTAQETEYALEQLMGYLVAGIGFFLILLKVINPYWFEFVTIFLPFLEDSRDSNLTKNNNPYSPILYLIIIIAGRIRPMAKSHKSEKECLEEPKKK